MASTITLRSSTCAWAESASLSRHKGRYSDVSNENRFSLMPSAWECPIIHTGKECRLAMKYNR